MNPEYYKQYYHLERKHWWFKARERIISAHVSKLINQGHLPQTGLKILNVGCGPGRSSENLTQYGNVTSVEYDRLCCEFAAAETGLEIINGSITDLPFDDGSFDLVCAFDVIEHVEDDNKAVAELKRVTKKEGVVFITVPAFQSLWSHHDVINHHYRRYKIAGIKRLFEARNGKAICATYFNFFLFIPIYVFRQASNILSRGSDRPGSGSDFETYNPGLMNTVLYRLMRFESTFINNGIKLPFGVSILYSWKKTN